MLETENLPQQCALSRTAAPQQNRDLAWLDVKVQTIEHTSPIVFHDQIAHRNDGHLNPSYEVKDGGEYRIGDDDQERCSHDRRSCRATHRVGPAADTKSF